MSLWSRLFRWIRTETPQAQPKSPIAHASRQPKEVRSVQLGIDFGTCWSKMVIRDYEANTERAFVLRVKKGKPAETDFRIPSAVTCVDDMLYFGWPGAQRARDKGATVYRSVKMRAAFPTAPEYSALPKLPEMLSSEDLATLVVAYLMQVGSAAAVDYTTALPDGPRLPKPSMTIGVPMSLGQHVARRDQFVRIARVAFEICQSRPPWFEKGLSVTSGRRLLDQAADKVEKKGPPSDARDWVRSEAEAGLHWVMQSPRVAPGLYMCADVGAGTTDVSAFRIIEHFEDGIWYKGRMAFYSAVSDLPGVDAIDTLIASRSGLTDEGVRGREEELIALHRLQSDGELREVTARMHNVYLYTWRQAYPKDVGVWKWKDYGLFVLGGGSKVKSVLSSLRQTPWPGQLENRQPIESEPPRDLFEMPTRTEVKQGESGLEGLSRFRGDPAFLLVAYGLSFRSGDVAPSDTPDEVPVYELNRSTRRSIDQDEYYPK